MLMISGTIDQICPITMQSKNRCCIVSGSLQKTRNISYMSTLSKDCPWLNSYYAPQVKEKCECQVELLIFQIQSFRSEVAPPKLIILQRDLREQIPEGSSIQTGKSSPTDKLKFFTRSNHGEKVRLSTHLLGKNVGILFFYLTTTIFFAFTMAFVCRYHGKLSLQ